MQIGEQSLAPSRSAPPAREASQAATGRVEVTVQLEALCWDTFAEDGREGDRPLPGATVTLSGHGGMIETGDDGVARFDNVRPGSVEVTASKAGYRESRASLSVQPHATGSCTVRLRNGQLECSRRHTRQPSGRTVANVLAPIFWVDEPVMLLFRDMLWVLFAAMTIIFFIVGLIGPQPNILAVGAAFFALFSWHTHIVFGLIPGVVTMLLAFLAFMGVAIMLLVGVTSSVVAPPDAGVFAIVCALWAGFITMLIAQRQRYATIYAYVPLLGALVGGVVALAVYPLVNWAASTVVDVPWWVGVSLFGLLLGYLGGLFSWAFVNDGNLESPHFGITDAKLPYIGERYCLQGHRGIFSHYDDGEEAYDFVAPIGTPVLAIKEGHIIAFDEQSSGADANAIYVRHRDGSIAEYLHLMNGGVSRFNREVVAEDLAANPVHCHPGQRLAASGDTGKAGTPHIHVAIHRKHWKDRDFIAFKFEDADVQRHEGRAFTMRKYRSDNLDRGNVIVPQ